MALAWTVPSFRMMCTSSPPGSTNPIPVVYTWGVQFGSSPSYSVTVPAVTVSRLWPGCECQPVVPPGCQTLLCTYTSDNPFVFCHDNQMLPPVGGGTNWLKTSISPNRPKASVVPLNPEAGVARSFPA